MFKNLCVKSNYYPTNSPLFNNHTFVFHASSIVALSLVELCLIIRSLNTQSSTSLRLLCHSALTLTRCSMDFLGQSLSLSYLQACEMTY